MFSKFHRNSEKTVEPNGTQLALTDETNPHAHSQLALINDQKIQNPQENTFDKTLDKSDFEPPHERNHVGSYLSKIFPKFLQNFWNKTGDQNQNSSFTAIPSTNKKTAKKVNIILEPSSFELHELYKGISQFYLLDQEGPNELLSLRIYFLKIAEYAYTTTIQLDQDYQNSHVTELILKHLDPLYDISLREAVLILLVNIFTPPQPNDFINDFLDNDLLPRIKIVIEEKIPSLSFPAIKLLCCLSSQDQLTQNRILDVFSPHNFGEWLEQSYSLTNEKDIGYKTAKQVMNLLETFSMFEIDLNLFHGIMQIVNEMIQRMNIKMFFRIINSFAMSQNPDIISSLCSYTNIFDEIKSILQNTEEPEKLLPPLQLLNILSYGNDSVQFDITVILPLITRAEKDISINAMQILSNLIINHSVGWEEIYQQENLKIIYDTVVESYGRRKLEAILLAATIVRIGNSRQLLQCNENFGDDETSNFITEFVDSIDSGDSEVIVSSLSAIARFIQFDEKGERGVSMTRFMNAGGKDQIEELLTSEDENVYQTANAFKFQFLQKKKKPENILRIDFSKFK